MSAVGGTAFGALTLFAGALAVDVWVYLDARSRSHAGDDVVATVGPMSLETPEQWLIASLLLWVFVVPLYLVAGRA